MRRTARLPLALVVMTWFAQLCLPVVHAAVMAAPGVERLAWCGNPAAAFAATAELPAEIRQAIEQDRAGAGHAVDCATLCATGAAPPPPTAVATTDVLRAAGLEPSPRAAPAPRAREQAPTPPAQGPPSRG